jgi:hypothetical protein
MIPLWYILPITAVFLLVVGVSVVAMLNLMVLVLGEAPEPTKALKKKASVRRRGPTTTDVV